VTIEILMPFYGRFDHFRVAVESVCAQSDADWRMTIIDDVNPDTTPGEWVRTLGDPRITYRRNANNLGVAGSFINAANLARADHAVIMGCDDVMLPGYVARARELVDRYPDVAIFQPGVEVIDEDGTRSLPLADRVKGWYRIRGAKPAVYGGEHLARSLLRGNWTYFPSICWKVEYLKRFPFRPDLDVVLDLALQLDILMAGGQMLVDSEVMFAYRRHSGSVSSWTASDGTRFMQEATLFAETATRMDSLGWKSAAHAARLHLSSRLNALTKLPQSMGRTKAASRRILLDHVFGP
jgi:glycosyltransferase involved in cell wall biosynthesis